MIVLLKERRVGDNDWKARSFEEIQKDHPNIPSKTPVHQPQDQDLEAFNQIFQPPCFGEKSVNFRRQRGS